MHGTTWDGPNCQSINQSINVFTGQEKRRGIFHIQTRFRSSFFHPPFACHFSDRASGRQHVINPWRFAGEPPQKRKRFGQLAGKGKNQVVCMYMYVYRKRRSLSLFIMDTIFRNFQGGFFFRAFIEKKRRDNIKTKQSYVSNSVQAFSFSFSFSFSFTYKNKTKTKVTN